MDTLRERLLGGLPLLIGPLKVRPCERLDLDLLGDWPAYPWPQQGLSFSFANLDPAARDRLWQQRQSQGDRITLVVDHAAARAMGYVALLEIDWHGRRVGNMAVRLHPTWCGQGLGTLLLDEVCLWGANGGIRAFALDVAAANRVAVRCYEKAGFRPQGEFWRRDENLAGADLQAPEFQTIGEHLRVQEGVVESRFLSMERNEAS